MKPGLLEILDRLYKLPNEDFEELIKHLNDFKLIKECVAKYNNSNNISEKEAKPTKKSLEDWKKIFEEAQYDKDFKIITNTPITIDYIGDIVVYKIHGKETKDQSRIEEVLNKLRGITSDSSKTLKPQDKISEYWMPQYHLTIKNATKLEEKFILDIVEKLYLRKNPTEWLLKQLSECSINIETDFTGLQNITIMVK
jgi:ribosomal protein L5